MKPTQAQIEAATKALQWMWSGSDDWQVREMAKVALAAAAEVEERPFNFNEISKAVEATTIERCAKVAEKYHDGPAGVFDISDQIAAAIRALKDKP